MREARGHWVVRTYRAGCVGEKIKFWVPESAARNQRKARAELRKQEQNESSAVRRLARLINANFTQGDYMIYLTYSDEGLSKLMAMNSGEFVGITEAACDEGEEQNKLRRAAEHQLQLYLRRVKHRAARLNPDAPVPVAWVAVTSDMDGKTGECVRVHHHLIVKREALELFAKCWSLGRVDWKPLRQQEDYTPVAEYLLEQVRRVPDEKKYASSRNLVRVEPRDRIVYSGAELRSPKGTVLLQRTEYKPGKPQYIRYAIRPQTENTGERGT